jgi:hypothetical protein
VTSSIPAAEPREPGSDAGWLSRQPSAEAEIGVAERTRAGNRPDVDALAEAARAGFQVGETQATLVELAGNQSVSAAARRAKVS